MIWRKSKANMQLLRDIWGCETEHPWCEQYGFIKNYHADITIRARTKILPQNMFNAYLYKEIWGKEHPGQYTKDSLVLHLPGIDNEERLKWIETILGDN